MGVSVNPERDVNSVLIIRTLFLEPIQDVLFDVECDRPLIFWDPQLCVRKKFCVEFWRIGGIDLVNMEECVRAGAIGIAAIRLFK